MRISPSPFPPPHSRRLLPPCAAFLLLRPQAPTTSCQLSRSPSPSSATTINHRPCAPPHLPHSLTPTKEPLLLHCQRRPCFPTPAGDLPASSPHPSDRRPSFLPSPACKPKPSLRLPGLPPLLPVAHFHLQPLLRRSPPSCRATSRRPGLIPTPAATPAPTSFPLHAPGRTRPFLLFSNQPPPLLWQRQPSSPNPVSSSARAATLALHPLQVFLPPASHSSSLPLPSWLPMPAAAPPSACNPMAATAGQQDHSSGLHLPRLPGSLISHRRPLSPPSFRLRQHPSLPPLPPIYSDPLCCRTSTCRLPAAPASSHLSDPTAGPYCVHIFELILTPSSRPLIEEEH